MTEQRSRGDRYAAGTAPAPWIKASVVISFLAVTMALAAFVSALA